MADDPAPGARETFAYRCLDGALPPRRIKLDRPGWAGDAEPRKDGSLAQPWHCAPFTEGVGYGFELLYPFKTGCSVMLEDGRPVFHGPFVEEQRPSVVWPPFQSANPAHYSMATLLDIRVPPGFTLRIEPHPRFFTDASGTVPAAVIGNVQTSWWPICLFVTFKSPYPGQVHQFAYGEPYCQVVAIPEHPLPSPVPMSEAECREREKAAQAIMKGRAKLCSAQWVARNNLRFDDTYKQLRCRIRTDGSDAIAGLVDGKS